MGHKWSFAKTMVTVKCFWVAVGRKDNIFPWSFIYHNSQEKMVTQESYSPLKRDTQWKKVFSKQIPKTESKILFIELSIQSQA